MGQESPEVAPGSLTSLHAGRGWLPAVEVPAWILGMGVVADEGVLEVPDGRRVGWLRRGCAGGHRVGYLHGQPGSRRDVIAFDDALQRYGLEMFSIDRAGYGDTDPVGLDRRDVAADLLSVADAFGFDSFSLLAVSMGGVYAVTTAALAPDRVSKVVLVSAHALPYDSPEIIGLLSEAEQEDVELLRNGRTPEVEADFAHAAASAATPEAALDLLRHLLADEGPAEAALADTAFLRAIADSVAFGLSGGHVGYLEDGLRTLRPLEIDPAAVTCPVRAVHGTVDGLEPLANLERLLARLPDTGLVTLPGLGHLGPWLWPDLPFALLTGH